jgi:hypothetical protein
MHVAEFREQPRITDNVIRAGLISRIAQTVDVDVVLTGSMELVSHRHVTRFLDGCDAHDVHILGMEGFRLLDGGTVQPDMNAILDCSYVAHRDDSRAAARSFIEMIAATELAYDFVFREE